MGGGARGPGPTPTSDPRSRTARERESRSLGRHRMPRWHQVSKPGFDTFSAMWRARLPGRRRRYCGRRAREETSPCGPQRGSPARGPRVPSRWSSDRAERRSHAGAHRPRPKVASMARSRVLEPLLTRVRASPERVGQRRRAKPRVPPRPRARALRWRQLGRNPPASAPVALARRAERPACPGASASIETGSASGRPRRV